VATSRRPRFSKPAISPVLNSVAMPRCLQFAGVFFLASLVAVPSADAQPNQKWVTAWTGSVQGPYPIGNPSAPTDLSAAFPVADTGAHDQSFRLIVKPDIWGRQTRIRLSNALGIMPVTFDAVYVGMQMTAAALVPGTNRPVAFAGKPSVTIAPGQSAWSDPVPLPFVREAEALLGRKLAVSFHVAGESGPMTWHAKALTTSYLTVPNAGTRGQEEGEAAFPISTTSWYFLDAIDMMAPAGTQLVVAFGDSITDGTASTLNGDDRWPDVLSRRLHAAGKSVSVVNAGIGGNQVVGPTEYSPQKPFAGGPSALQRLERDVLSLSGVSAVIWLEGINDLSMNGNRSASAVQSGMQDGVKRMRARIAGVRIIGATLTPALGSTNAVHGSLHQDEQRKALNQFIRTGGLFDDVVDFDRVTLDTRTGAMQPEYVPDTTTGARGDKLHPNRLGYLAMGMAVDLNTLLPKTKAAGR
jgi:lysophospholipase L1-like esterase